MFNIYAALLALSSFLVTIYNTASLGAYYDAPKRLLLSGLLLLLAAVYFVKDLKLKIPVDKKFLMSLLVSVVAVFVAYAMNKSGMFVLGLSHILLFFLGVAISSAFYNTKTKEELLKSFIYLQALSSLLCIFWALLNEVLFPTGLKSFFGNPNILSDYLMLAVLQFLFLFEISKKQHMKTLSGVMAFVATVYILYLGGRASLIGLGLGLLVFLFSSSKVNLSELYKKHKGKVQLTLLTVGILGIYILSAKGFASLSYRLTHWGNTLHLIADNPFGVGAGNFELAYGPYNGKFFETVESSEGIIVANPHNTFLEFIAEIGVVGAFAFFTFIYFIIRAQFPKSGSYNLTGRWVLSNLAALFGVSLFAFPQDNIYTLFFLSLCFGFALSNGQWKKTVQSPFSKIVVFSLALLTSVTIGLKSYSSHQTFLFADNPEKRLGDACAFDIENWKACVGLVEYYTLTNDIEKAQKQLGKVEARFPDFFALLRARAELKLKMGDVGGACLDYKSYDSLYANKSSKSDWIKSNCH